MSKESTLNLFRRLEQLNGIGAALSRERDIDRLLENILEAAKTITGADGGTLYSVTDDQSALKFEILRTDSLGISLGGAPPASPSTCRCCPCVRPTAGPMIRWWRRTRPSTTAR